MFVIRDAAGEPLVAFDGNGTTYFLDAGLYLEAHDIPVPITDEDVRAVLVAP